jgi:hypothetical protein
MESAAAAPPDALVDPASEPQLPQLDVLMPHIPRLPMEVLLRIVESACVTSVWDVASGLDPDDEEKAKSQRRRCEGPTFESQKKRS